MMDGEREKKESLIFFFCFWKNWLIDIRFQPENTPNDLLKKFYQLITKMNKELNFKYFNRLSLEIAIIFFEIVRV